MSQIAKTADRSFADRLVLRVTAAIYRKGEEKPAMRWSFEMGIGPGKSKKMLFDFIFRVRTVFMVDCSTDCLRMVTGVSPLALCPLHSTDRSTELTASA